MKVLFNLILGVIFIIISGDLFINFLGSNTLLSGEKQLYFMLVVAFFFLLLGAIHLISTCKRINFKWCVAILFLTLVSSIILLILFPNILSLKFTIFSIILLIISFIVSKSSSQKNA